MKRKITMYGNGKVAQALVRGLDGNKNYSLTVIGSRESSDLSWFKKRGVTVSKNAHDVSTADCLILAVTPTAVGAMFERLQEVQMLPLVIISLVSGLSRSRIFSHLEVPDARIMNGTTNTAIAKKRGLTVLSIEGGRTAQTFAAELFSSLGVVEHEPTEEIIKSVVTVGSDNGFNSKTLMEIYQKEYSGEPLYHWLENCKFFLDGNAYSLASCVTLKEHIETKIRILMHVFSYSRLKAEHRVRTSFLSTLRYLLEIGHDVCVQDMQELIGTVVTKNGCTEKGIQKLVYEHLKIFRCIDDIFSLVWTRAQTFSKDVSESLA